MRNTVAKAIQARSPSAGTLLHHSDRGCQYTSESFQDLLRTLQITCSMSRTGCCYDNAVAERFFWSLKHEWTKFESYENLDDAKISVFKYIEIFLQSSASPSDARIPVARSIREKTKDAVSCVISFRQCPPVLG
jgi:putative transposase